jgi:succinyl-CoA synthetase alpha subunit
MSGRAPLTLDGVPQVLVQGITGREASFWTERMTAYGTPVVAGVVPGKGGQQANGVPVYDSVEAACHEHAIDMAVLFVPSRAVKAAALDVLRAGVRQVVVLVEHIPVHDMMEVFAEAEARGARVLGGNSPGLVVPGRYFVGILPAWEPTIFRPGAVGVVSRSGSLGTLVSVNLARAGLGQSAFVGIGGDPIVGTTFLDVLQMFEDDPRTDAVALLGELGGGLEEQAAEYIGRMRKPVVAFIGGQSAPPGKRMGHAGAIVAGAGGTAASKMAVLREAGARVADVPSQVSAILADVLCYR